jgi:hypothetical protein
MSYVYLWNEEITCQMLLDLISMKQFFFNFKMHWKKIDVYLFMNKILD